MMYFNQIFQNVDDLISDLFKFIFKNESREATLLNC